MRRRRICVTGQRDVFMNSSRRRLHTLQIRVKATIITTWRYKYSVLDRCCKPVPSNRRSSGIRMFSIRLFTLFCDGPRGNVRLDRCRCWCCSWTAHRGVRRRRRYVRDGYTRKTYKSAQSTRNARARTDTHTHTQTPTDGPPQANSNERDSRLTDWSPASERCRYIVLGHTRVRSLSLSPSTTLALPLLLLFDFCCCGCRWRRCRCCCCWCNRRKRHDDTTGAAEHRVPFYSLHCTPFVRPSGAPSTKRYGGFGDVHTDRVAATCVVFDIIIYFFIFSFR